MDNELLTPGLIHGSSVPRFMSPLRMLWVMTHEMVLITGIVLLYSTIRSSGAEYTVAHWKLELEAHPGCPRAASRKKSEILTGDTYS